MPVLIKILKKMLNTNKETFIMSCIPKQNDQNKWLYPLLTVLLFKKVIHIFSILNDSVFRTNVFID